ncbi:hypothetical protein ADUPG1_010986, partial [Aduncisulcus paluster]
MDHQDHVDIDIDPETLFLETHAVSSLTHQVAMAPPSKERTNRLQALRARQIARATSAVEDLSKECRAIIQSIKRKATVECDKMKAEIQDIRYKVVYTLQPFQVADSFQSRSTSAESPKEGETDVKEEKKDKTPDKKKKESKDSKKSKPAKGSKGKKGAKEDKIEEPEVKKEEPVKKTGHRMSEFALKFPDISSDIKHAPPLPSISYIHPKKAYNYLSEAQKSFYYIKDYLAGFFSMLDETFRASEDGIRSNLLVAFDRAEKANAYVGEALEQFKEKLQNIAEETKVTLLNMEEDLKIEYSKKCQDLQQFILFKVSDCKVNWQKARLFHLFVESLCLFNTVIDYPNLTTSALMTMRTRLESLVKRRENVIMKICVSFGDKGWKQAASATVGEEQGKEEQEKEEQEKGAEKNGGATTKLPIPKKLITSLDASPLVGSLLDLQQALTRTQRAGWESIRAGWIEDIDSILKKLSRYSTEMRWVVGETDDIDIPNKKSHTDPVHTDPVHHGTDDAGAGTTKGEEREQDMNGDIDHTKNTEDLEPALLSPVIVDVAEPLGSLWESICLDVLDAEDMKRDEERRRIKEAKRRKEEEERAKAEKGKGKKGKDSKKKDDVKGKNANKKKGKGIDDSKKKDDVKGKNANKKKGKGIDVTPDEEEEEEEEENEEEDHLFGQIDNEMFDQIKNKPLFLFSSQTPVPSTIPAHSVTSDLIPAELSNIESFFLHFLVSKFFVDSTAWQHRLRNIYEYSHLHTQSSDALVTDLCGLLEKVSSIGDFVEDHFYKSTILFKQNITSTEESFMRVFAEVGAKNLGSLDRLCHLYDASTHEGLDIMLNQARKGVEIVKKEGEKMVKDVMNHGTSEITDVQGFVASKIQSVASEFLFELTVKEGNADSTDDTVTKEGKGKKDKSSEKDKGKGKGKGKDKDVLTSGDEDSLILPAALIKSFSGCLHDDMNSLCKCSALEVSIGDVKQSLLLMLPAFSSSFSAEHRKELAMNGADGQSDSDSKNSSSKDKSGGKKKAGKGDKSSKKGDDSKDVTELDGSSSSSTNVFYYLSSKDGTSFIPILSLSNSSCSLLLFSLFSHFFLSLSLQIKNHTLSREQVHKKVLTSASALYSSSLNSSSSRFAILSKRDIASLSHNLNRFIQFSQRHIERLLRKLVHLQAEFGIEQSLLDENESGVQFESSEGAGGKGRPGTAKDKKKKGGKEKNVTEEQEEEEFLFFPSPLACLLNLDESDISSSASTGGTGKKADDKKKKDSAGKKKQSAKTDSSTGSEQLTPAQSVSSLVALPFVPNLVHESECKKYANLLSFLFDSSDDTSSSPSPSLLVRQLARFSAQFLTQLQKELLKRYKYASQLTREVHRDHASFVQDLALSGASGANPTSRRTGRAGNGVKGGRNFNFKKIKTIVEKRIVRRTFKQRVKLTDDEKRMIEERAAEEARRARIQERMERKAEERSQALSEGVESLSLSGSPNVNSPKGTSAGGKGGKSPSKASKDKKDKKGEMKKEEEMEWEMEEKKEFGEDTEWKWVQWVSEMEVTKEEDERILELIAKRDGLGQPDEDEEKDEDVKASKGAKGKGAKGKGKDSSKKT